VRGLSQDNNAAVMDGLCLSCVPTLLVHTLPGAVPRQHVLATDPYPLWHRRDIAITQVFCEALLQACQRHHKAAQMLIQGFRVPAGQEYLLGEAMCLMARCGIDNIAIWSYLATGYMFSHTCANAPRVWEVFTHTMQALRSSLPSRTL
jgi:hypothetical protein